MKFSEHAFTPQLLYAGERAPLPTGNRGWAPESVCTLEKRETLPVLGNEK